TLPKPDISKCSASTQEHEDISPSDRFLRSLAVSAPSDESLGPRRLPRLGVLSEVAVRQGFSYGVIGLIQIVVDWMTLVVLSYWGLSTTTANVLGRTAGATLGFWMNGKYSFGKPGQALIGWAHL